MMLNDRQVVPLHPVGSLLDGVVHADQNRSTKQNKNPQTIFEHEQRDECTELGGGSEPCTCWLGIMMYGSDQTACWAIM